MVDIIVDVRERALLAEMGDAVTKQAQLNLGDVEINVDGVVRLVIERKTLADLAASVKDGRYREQKARLLANIDTERVVYVIETAGFAFDGQMRDVGGLPASTLQGCVISMILRDGVRVVMTRDVQDTAAFIKRVADRLGRMIAAKPSNAYANAACAATCVSARKRDNVDPSVCFRHQMSQIPGVSVTLAGTICEEFGSMRELFARLAHLPRSERIKTFASLSLIGPKIATRLDAYMFAEPAASLTQPALGFLSVADECMLERGPDTV